MNDILLQPVMSMYSTDPGTGLTIISPRVYRLRQLQACDGLNVSDLRLEQRGLAPITYMHHVSKIIEGNTESYRVRICRTCSGLPTLLELGSYTDVESALLVNDVHELMQDRTKQLHLLCIDDMKYFNSIAVRRRGSPHDLQITSVLQERLWKKSSAASATAKKLLKEAAINIEADTRAVGACQNTFKTEQQSDIFSNAVPGFGPKSGSVTETNSVNVNSIYKNDGPKGHSNEEAASEKMTPSFSANDVRNSLKSNYVRNRSKDMSDSTINRFTSISVVDEGKSRRDCSDVTHDGQDQGLLPPKRIESYDSSAQHQYNVGNEFSQSSYNCGLYQFNEGEDSLCGLSADLNSAASSLNDGQENKQAGSSAISEHSRIGIINRPSSQALSRAGRIVDQLRANLVRYHTTFLQWNFFDCAADIDRMFLALAEFVGAELTHVISSASMRRNGSRGGGSADSVQAVAAAETSLRESWKMGRAPRSCLLSTIASVFPGNSMEMQMVCKRVASIIAQDTPSVSHFNDLYAQAVDEIQKIDNDIRAYDFTPSTPTPLQCDANINEDCPSSGKPVSVDGEPHSSDSSPLNAAPLSFCFKDCEEFIRQSYNAASYFDNSLRLCSWDGELSGVQEAEVKLHGIYSQLENRFIALTQFLHIVTSANAAALKHASDRKSFANSLTGCKENNFEVQESSGVSDASAKDEAMQSVTDDSVSDSDTSIIHIGVKGSINARGGTNSSWSKVHRESDALRGAAPENIIPELEEASSVEAEIASLLKKTTLCVTYSILALTSAASVAWRLCGDTLSASSCIRACNNFLPILVENVSNPAILQEFIQRHLDLMTSIILYSGRSRTLGAGFGVLGPSNDGGGINFVFSRYRPSELKATRGSASDQEEDSKCRSSSSISSCESHTELRLLAFSLGGEIVKQSRRCFSSFPKQLAGPAAMVHFEAAFRVYVAIFLASLALEESDLLMKLGYTVERLLSATNDVLSSLQERITKQNCTLVSTHTLISLHAMAEACIFHSKRYVECANTVFMIVRSCRLLLWGCSSRFVLAKMLLEHIAAEEGKRLFADDKEQAAHLMTLKSAADQIPGPPWDQQVGEALPYSTSASSIFSPFDHIDKYGVTQYSNPDTDMRGDLNPFEVTQLVGTSKRYHNETAEKGGRMDLSCAGISKKKRGVGSGGNGNANRGRVASDVKARPAQLASSSSASNILAAMDSQNRQSFFYQKQQMIPTQLPLETISGRTEFLNFEAVDALYQHNQINYMSHSQQPPSELVPGPGPSINFPSRLSSEKSVMISTMNMNMGVGSNPGLVQSLTPMSGVGSSSWTRDGSAVDCPAIYDGISPSMGYTNPLAMGSLCNITSIPLSYGSHTDLSRMQHTDFVGCKIAPPNEQPRMWQQQQDLLYLQKGQQK